MRYLTTPLLACCMAATAAPGAEPPSALPAKLTLGIERLRLPGSEPMGLVGTSYVLELAPGWWVGPALYGAASGHRGGLFTWGAEAQYRWRPAPRWQLVGGVYAGGGGGAAAPVGGGLMLRPHADLMFDLGAWSVGIGASRVDFPSGDIRSTQLALLASFGDRFTFAPAGATAAHFDGPAGLGISHLGVAVGHYAAQGAQGGAFSTVGMQAEWPLGGQLSAVAQAAGAAKGGADGYAEFTVGLLALWPAADSTLRWGVQGNVGMGGGGAVATGGGTIARLALVSRLRVSPAWSLELQAGRARAFTGDFNTRYAQIGAGFDFGSAATPGAAQPVRETQWALGVEQVLHASRKAGGDPGLGAVSLEVRRAVGDHVYLSARAVSAISGGAGAYSAGLLGVGRWWALDHAGSWRAGIEAAAGAAGGGGVASQGGAIVQPAGWIGRRFGSQAELRLAVGHIRSARGGLSSPVVGISGAMAFGTP